MEFVWYLLVMLGAYLIGSFPTGYLLVKALKGQDIREFGSGNTGATNVKRVLGKRAFVSVMLIDGIKGILAVVLAQYLDAKLGLNSQGILSLLAAVAVVIGHSKSIFLGFTGGKSVATTCGTILGLNFLVGLVVFVIWATVSYCSRYISLGSIVAVAVLPFCMYFFKAPLSYVIYCAIAAIYVIYLHRENIKRLMNGTENKVR